MKAFVVGFLFLLILVEQQALSQGVVCVGVESSTSETNRAKCGFTTFVPSDQEMECSIPEFYKTKDYTENDTFSDDLLYVGCDVPESYTYDFHQTQVVSNEDCGTYLTAYSGEVHDTIEPNMGNLTKEDAVASLDDGVGSWLIDDGYSTTGCGATYTYDAPFYDIEEPLNPFNFYNYTDDPPALGAGPLPGASTTYMETNEGVVTTYAWTVSIDKEPTKDKESYELDETVGTNPPIVWTIKTDGELSDLYDTTDLLAPFSDLSSGFGSGGASASAIISGNQESADLTGARVKFKVKASGQFSLPYTITTIIGSETNVESGSIQGYGNGTTQYYPSGDPIEIDPPYASISYGDCDYYVGGAATLSLAGYLDILDGNDKGRHQLCNCQCGMPTWSVSEPYINLWVKDKPAEYTTSLGEKIGFIIFYTTHDTHNQSIENQSPFLPSTGWNNNWSSFVHFTTTSGGWSALVFERDGGETDYSSDQTQDPNSGDQLLPINGGNPSQGSPAYGTGGFRLVHSDGSQDVFSLLTPRYSTNEVEQIPMYIDGGDKSHGPVYWTPDGPEFLAPVYEYSPTEVGSGSGTGVGLSSPSSSVPIPVTNLTMYAGWQNSVVPGVYTNMMVTNQSAPYQDALLTEHIDPFGNSIRVTYTNSANGQYFIKSIVDYDGKTTLINYDTNNMIASVRMPYNHNAFFNCDTNGMILNVTDAMGMASAFVYNTNRDLTTMVTPYGMTFFDYFDAETNSVAKINSGVERAIRIINPDDSFELYALFNSDTNTAPGVYTNSLPYIPTGYGPLDLGDTNNDFGALYQRNSFYWDREQCSHLSATDPASLSSLTPADFNLGRMRHWMLESDGVSLSSANSLVREPSPDGTKPGEAIWYIYQTTASPWVMYSGNELPAAMLRLQPDGTTYAETFSYNSYAQPMDDIAYCYKPDGTGLGLQYNGTFEYTEQTYYSDCSTNGTDLGTTSWNASLLQYIAGPSIPGASLNADYTATQNAVEMFTNGSFLSTITLTVPQPPSSIQNNAGDTVNLFYNNRAQITGFQLPAGLMVTNLYGADGFLAESIGLQVKSTNSYAFTNGLLLAKTDPLGKTTAYTWDQLQRLTGISYPDNTTISNIYTNLDLSAQKDRLGSWTYAQYDDMNRKISSKDRNGNVTKFSYCMCGGLESITDPYTNTTVLSRENDDLVTSIIYSDTHFNRITQTLLRDCLGEVTNFTDTSGLNINYAYDYLGRVTNVNSAGSTLYFVTYDELNRPLTIQDPQGVTVNNTYDAAERLTEQSLPDSISRQWDYVNGLVDFTVDGLNNSTYYTYNPAGWLTTVTDANGHTNGYTYNAAGEIKTLADGNGHVTSWGYDVFGHAISKTDGNGVLVETNAYDADGRLIAHWTPAKGLGQLTHDANGNLTSAKYLTMTNAYSYDILNRLATMSDTMGSSLFRYKDFGAFQSALSAEDGPWPSDTVTNHFSGWMRSSMTVIQPSSSWTVNYSYDDLLRLTGVSSPAGSFGYSYNGVGDQVATLSLPGGNSITNAYGNAGELLATALLHGSTLLDFSKYSYDDNGNRTSVTRANNAYVNYGYDNMEQLTSAMGYDPGSTLRDNENFSYQYDAADNLTNRDNNDLHQVFMVDPANQLTNINRNAVMTVAGNLTNSVTSLTINGQSAAIYNDLTFAAPSVALNDGLNTLTALLTTVSGTVSNTMLKTMPASVNLVYDQNGNLVYDGQKAYAYDCANELTSVTITNQWMNEYQYDGLGRRRIDRRSVWSGGAWVRVLQKSYIYDGNLVVQERDGDNNPVVNYTRGLDLGGSTERAGGIGGLLARTDANGSAFYHADGNGNITAMVNSSGTPVARYLYDSFGNTLAMSGVLASVNMYRFSSKEIDPESGDYYYGHRFYDPNYQRWLNRDPIQEWGGINLYRFVGNNPINLRDALGLQVAFSDPWAAQTWANLTRGESITSSEIPASGGGGDGSGDSGSFTGTSATTVGGLNVASDGLGTLTGSDIFDQSSKMLGRTGAGLDLCNGLNGNDDMGTFLGNMFFDSYGLMGTPEGAGFGAAWYIGNNVVVPAVNYASPRIADWYYRSTTTNEPPIVPGMYDGSAGVYWPNESPAFGGQQ